MKYEFISITGEQFVVTHTVLYVEISASLDKWVTHTHTHTHTFCENIVTTRNCFSLYFCTKMTYLRICGGIFVASCKIVYLCVTTNCYFMGDKLFV